MGCGCKKSEAEVLINKVKSIARGWSNVVWPDKEIEKIAYARIAICADCDCNIKNLCKDCGCWIPAKARSPDEKCNKWDK